MFTFLLELIHFDRKKALENLSSLTAFSHFSNPEDDAHNTYSWTLCEIVIEIMNIKDLIKRLAYTECSKFSYYHYYPRNVHYYGYYPFLYKYFYYLIILPL